MKTQLLAIYERLLGPFAMNGVEMIVQGAVLNWSWLVPDFENAFKNVDVLLAAGKKYKDMRFHQSGWTDHTRVFMRLSKSDAEFQFRWWEMNLNAHQPRQGFS